ncbi:MAG: HAD hydrolase-like protein, partial [Candidatus Izemoplasmatales bacterium]|nr:HAD hydrolase-like protein [Candidatus Izemoplasmatales bacterium]
MLNTLLFDLDGTLIDSNELIIASFQKVLAEFMPNRSFSRHEIIAMIGPPLWETFAGFTDDPVTNEKMISRYRETYCELEFAYIDIYPH